MKKRVPKASKIDSKVLATVAGGGCNGRTETDKKGRIIHSGGGGLISPNPVSNT